MQIFLLQVHVCGTRIHTHVCVLHKYIGFYIIIHLLTCSRTTIATRQRARSQRKVWPWCRFCPFKTRPFGVSLMVVRGARGTRRVVMTAGERGGSVSQAWSSDLGSISITRKGNRAGTGSTSLSHTHTYTYITYTYSRHRHTHSRCDPSLSHIYIYK